MEADTWGQESPFLHVKPELDVLLVKYRRVDCQDGWEILGGKRTT